MEPLTPRAQQLLAIYRHFHRDYTYSTLVSYVLYDDRNAGLFRPPLLTVQQIHANFWGPDKCKLDRAK
jgi:hypothetical protein